MSGDRLAAVFPLPLEDVHLGKDVGLIPEGLRRRGWEVEMHCLAAPAGEWPTPVHVASRAQLGDPAYWSGRGLAAAVAFTFVANGDISRALRSAAVRVIAKGDTQGLVSPRLHAREMLREAVWHEGPPLQRARALASWLARAGPLHRAQVREVREAVGAADAFVVESEIARRRIARVLERYGGAALADRLHVVLNPVAATFTRGSVRAEREPLVVAIGRWNDPAKNAPLLAAALERFLDRHPGHRAHVVGTAAEQRFRPRADGRLIRTPHVGQDDLREILSRARIVVSSSRWESFSMAAHEGLASGCTVVGPPLTPFRHATSLGAFGAVASRRGAAGLADALRAEAGAWDAGERDPLEISAFWRGLLDVDTVAERFDGLLAGQAGARGRRGRSTTSS